MAKGGKARNAPDSGAQESDASVETGSTVFYGDEGDDRIRGGNGFDIVQYSGSIWDYEYRTGFKGAWIVEDQNTLDGDTGRDELIRIDAIQFDDALVYLDRNNPLFIDAPDRLRISVDETISFSITATDYDQNVNNISFNPEYDFGYLGRTGGTSQSSYTGEQVTVNYTYDPQQFNSPLRMQPEELAEGEVSEQVFTFQISAEEGPYTHTVIIEVVGINDAPEIAAGFYAISGTGALAGDVLDLTLIGSDVDSDDTGSTLNYEIVSITPGFSATIENGILAANGGQAVVGLDTDETVEGEIWVRAVDAWGAASQAVLVEVTLSGDGLPEAPYLTGTGGINWDAFGVIPGQGLQFGVLNGFDDDPGNLDVITATDEDDIIQINATSMANFTGDGQFYEFNGVENYDSLPILMGDGDDVFVLSLSDPQLSQFSSVDIGTGAGDDVVALDMQSQSVVYANGVQIQTGQGSDQVLLHLAGGQETSALFDVSTGTGHDVVDVQITDLDPTNGPGGYQIAGGSYNLGSGDDRLTIEVTGTLAFASLAFGLDINAGSGDDFVFFSNADVSLRDDAIFFGGGYDGEIELGAGSDTLILDLSQAQNGANELEINADGFGSDTGSHDVVVLQHLHIDTDIEYTIDAYGNVSLQHDQQAIFIRGAEEVLLADGTDLLLLA